MDRARPRASAAPPACRAALAETGCPSPAALLPLALPPSNRPIAPRALRDQFRAETMLINPHTSSCRCGRRSRYSRAMSTLERVKLPDAPAVVAGARMTVILTPDGELEELEPAAARRRLARAAPIACHPRALARPLRLPGLCCPHLL